jgi:hypothetical protein
MQTEYRDGQAISLLTMRKKKSMDDKALRSLANEMALTT